MIVQSGKDIRDCLEHVADAMAALSTVGNGKRLAIEISSDRDGPFRSNGKLLLIEELATNLETALLESQLVQPGEWDPRD